ncbi:MAG: AAA family ATPase [Tagaea sp.]|nr:AAA family ATPase [Tagaea sp.]
MPYRKRPFARDDVPLEDLQAQELWRTTPLGRFQTYDPDIIWRYLLEVWPAIQKRSAFKSAKKLDEWSLTELALAARAANLDEDVQGSLWYLSALRHSPIPVAALLALLLGPLPFPLVTRERRAAASYWRKCLMNSEPIDKAADLGRHFSRVASLLNTEKALVADALGPSDQRRLMVLCPSLLAELDTDSDLKPYRILGAPIALWHSMISPEIVGRALKLEFPHLEQAIPAVVEAVMDGGARVAPAVLLVGPPGIGKDSLWRRACTLSGRPFVEFELAGSADSRTLRGTSRGWSSRTPSYPAMVARRLGIANPFLILTELDKAGGSQWNGVVADTLLSWLEAGSRSAWHDEGLGLTIDLSRFTFGFSANNLDQIPGPLRSRLRIIRLESIRETHVSDLLQQAVQRRAATLGIRSAEIPEIDPRVVAKLRGHARKGRLNLRMLERLIAVIAPATPIPSNTVIN